MAAMPRKDRMAKKSRRPAAAKRAATKLPPPKGRSLAELNRWITANHDTLMKLARENCIRLTGKPTLGGRRKKSA